MSFSHFHWLWTTVTIWMFWQHLCLLVSWLFKKKFSDELTVFVQLLDDLLYIGLRHIHAQTAQDLAQFSRADSVVMIPIERPEKLADLCTQTKIQDMQYWIIAVKGPRNWLTKMHQIRKKKLIGMKIQWWRDDAFDHFGKGPGSGNVNGPPSSRQTWWIRNVKAWCH